MNNHSSANNIETVNQLIENVHKHIAWYGQINGQEAEKILKSCPKHTYLLRSGENNLHYFFSYVSDSSVVFHQSIRLNTEKVGYYENGGAGYDRNKVFATVELLISDFLDCHQNDLLPLSNELCQAQGF